MLYEGKRLQKGKVPRKRGMPKKSGRRLLSGLLALVLCLTLVPVIFFSLYVSNTTVLSSSSMSTIPALPSNAIVIVPSSHFPGLKGFHSSFLIMFMTLWAP